MVMMFLLPDRPGTNEELSWGIYQDHVMSLSGKAVPSWWTLSTNGPKSLHGVGGSRDLLILIKRVVDSLQKEPALNTIRYWLGSNPPMIFSILSNYNARTGKLNAPEIQDYLRGHRERLLHPVKD